MYHNYLPASLFLYIIINNIRIWNMFMFIFHKIFQDSIYRSCLYFACVVHVCSQGEIRCKAPAEGDPVLATCPEENVNPEQDDMHRLVECIPKILCSSSVRAPVSALIIIYIRTCMVGTRIPSMGCICLTEVIHVYNAYLRGKMTQSVDTFNGSLFSWIESTREFWWVDEPSVDGACFA